MDIVTTYKDEEITERGSPAHLPQIVDPNSLCGRLLDLMRHLERHGHVSPVDQQLVLTLVHHPEMPQHLKSDSSRPSYFLSSGYDGPAEGYYG